MVICNSEKRASNSYLEKEVICNSEKGPIANHQIATRGKGPKKEVMIPTVLGPIESSSVTEGCSPHECLLQKPSSEDLAAIKMNPLTLANLSEVRSCVDYGTFSVSNKLFSLDESVQELGALEDAGGALVVACETAEDGRDPEGLAEIARRSKVGVVMAASWNLQGVSTCN